MLMAKLFEKWKRTTVIAVVGAIVILVALVATVVYLANNNDVNPSSTPQNTQTITVEGEFVCLPKEGDGPHTLECTFGLLADDGTYYQLDFTELTGKDPTAIGNFQTGERGRITGIYKTQESIYVSEGVITVESVR